MFSDLPGLSAFSHSHRSDLDQLELINTYAAMLHAFTPLTSSHLFHTINEPATTAALSNNEQKHTAHSDPCTDIHRVRYVLLDPNSSVVLYQREPVFPPRFSCTHLTFRPRLVPRLLPYIRQQSL